MFTMWKHGRADGTVAQLRRVGEKMSGPRPRPPTPPPWKKTKTKAPPMLCVYHVDISFISFCACFLCVPQTEFVDAHHCQLQHSYASFIIWPVLNLGAYHMLTRECTEKYIYI